MSGHRAYYVSVLATALLDEGAEVLLATQRSELVGEEFRIHLSSIASRLKYVEVRSLLSGTGVRAALKRFKSFSDAVQVSNPCRVYIPYADGLAQAWGMQLCPSKILPASTTVEILMMRGAFAYPSTSSIRRMRDEAALLAIQRLPCDRVHWLDQLAFECVRKRGGRLSQISSLMPEAIQPRVSVPMADARAKLGIPDIPTYCCPGTVDTRKGADLLISAFALIARERTAQLLLIGKHEECICSQLNEKYQSLVRERKIISIDRYVENLELDLGFDASDVICVPYPSHIGSASILVKAASLKKTIVASNWGWIGWATKTFELGEACEVSDPQSLKHAMIKCLDAKYSKRSEKAEAFTRFHTTANHVDAWLHRFRSSNAKISVRRSGSSSMS